MSLCIVIPARSGSKGIPDKNLSLINGKSLVSITLSHALSLVEPSEIVFTSDSSSYLEHASHTSPFIHLRKRPSSLSTDDSTALNTWRDAVTHYETATGNEPMASIYLEPTCPFRNIEFIKHNLSLFLNSSDDLWFSVSETDSKYRLEKQLFLDKNSSPRSFYADHNDFYSQKQNSQVSYHKNGVFYFAKISHLTACQSLFSGKQKAIITTHTTVNIDTPEDLAFARFLSVS